MKLSGATWCVLGGAGFIGSHFIDYIFDVARPKAILCYDNFSRGRLENLKTHLHDDRLVIVNYDLEHPVYEQPLNRENLIMVNFAAKVGNIEYNRHNQFTMMHTNLIMAEAFAETVRVRKPKLVVQVSTACVYGPKAPVPTPEKYGETCNPEPTSRGYAIAKWISEQYARYFVTDLEVPTICVRFFNAVGPRDYYDRATSHVVPALIRKAYENDYIEIWGSGKQKRVFVDARDIAKDIYRLCNMSHRSADGYPINIGHNDMISIRKLAELIRELSLMYGKEIVINPGHPDGCKKRAASTKRLDDLLGMAIARMPLRQTLIDMIRDYHRQIRDGFIND